MIRTWFSYVQGSDNIFEVVDGLIQGDTGWHLDGLATTWQLRRDCAMWSPVWGRVWVADGSRHRPSDNKGPDTLTTGNNRADINTSFSTLSISNQAHFSNTKNKNTYCYVNIFGRRVWTPNCLLGIVFPVYEYVWLRTELIWPANYNIGHSKRWIALLHFSLSIIGEHFDRGTF